MSRTIPITTAEDLTSAVQDRLLTCGMTLDHVAALSGVRASTIAHIRTGRTRWPRHTTILPLLPVLGLELCLRRTTNR